MAPYEQNTGGRAPGQTQAQASFPQLKYPALREDGLRMPLNWLNGKRLADGAEGLWRIHDKLYDLSDFAAKHPGGEDWIALTQGTDITEAFETHHLARTAEALLPGLYARDATSPRNSPFTFHKDGFYKTLKPKIHAEVERVGAAEARKSDRVTDRVLACVALLSPLASCLATRSWLLAAPVLLVAGFALSALTICGHNYLHRRDNWRMYLFNLSGFSYLEWRVSHALSHHLHTNTAQDVELSQLEPFLQYLPRAGKPLWAQFGALYFPVVFTFISIGSMIKGCATTALGLDGCRPMRVSELLPLALPVWMWVASGSSLHAFGAWICLTLISSLVFMVVGLTAGHHSNNNFFDGDVPRSKTPDWGVHQLDTVEERSEYMGKHALSLTRFGDHALHHLFPTLDHALLPHLYPVLRQHCAEHGVRLRVTTQMHAVVAQSRQLARRNPHDFSQMPPLLARI